MSLCTSCANVREVVSGTGSVFLLCRLSQTENRFPKYPPQPVVRCDGYEEKPHPATRWTLERVPGTFAVCRLNADAQVPEWATGQLLSITRTRDELSVVCSQERIPECVRCEPGWTCLRVVGPLDFSMVGVISSITGTLAAANISVMTISTFDTDYVLVKAADLESAATALTTAGHTIQTAPARW